LVPNKYLQIDYNVHPDFQFGDQCWNLEHDLVREFNEIYVQIHAAITVFNRNRLLELIDHIFVSLSVDVDNDADLKFIHLLRLEVERLMQSHLRFYSKITNPRVNQSMNFAEPKSWKSGIVSGATLNRLNKLTKKSVKLLIQKSQFGEGDRASLSISSGWSILRLTRILNREFSRSQVLEYVGQLVPYNVKVVGVALELSTDNPSWWKHEGLNQTDPKTKYAHFDEGIESPKAIVYLSKVGMSNGPFSYYPYLFEQLDLSPFQLLVSRCIGNVAQQMFGSIADSVRPTSTTTFRRLYMKLPREIRSNSHFGWDVIPNSNLESVMTTSETFLLGDAGTFIVFDGPNIVHRGGRVEEGQRIALQVIFGHRSLRKELLSIVSFIVRRISK
jgi:hypothetical protein